MKHARGRLAAGAALAATMVTLALLTRTPPSVAPYTSLTVPGPRLELRDGPWLTLRRLGRLEAPVRLADAWAFLDPTQGLVHVLSDGDTDPLRFGGLGDGPGELRLAELLTAVADTLWVGQVTGLRFDAFTRDGRFLRRVRAASTPCRAPVLHALSATGRTLIAAIQCFDLAGDGFRLTQVDTRTGLVEDSPWPGARGGEALTLTRLLIGGEGRGLMLASSEDPCLRDLNGVTVRCLDAQARVLVPRSTRDSLRARLGPSARRLGRKVALPTHYPYLEAVFSGSEGPIVSRPTPGGRVVHPVPPNGGDAPWILRLDDRTRAFAADTHLLLVRDGPAGIELARHDLRRAR